jgi:hypothetical protein
MHFPRGKCGRVASAQFPAVPTRVRHASERVTFLQPAQQQTKIKRMPRNQKPGIARIDLDITKRSRPLVFSISANDVIDPGIMERLEAKLDQALQAIESLT